MLFSLSLSHPDPFAIMVLCTVKTTMFVLFSPFVHHFHELPLGAIGVPLLRVASVALSLLRSVLQHLSLSAPLWMDSFIDHRYVACRLFLYRVVFLPQGYPACGYSFPCPGDCSIAWLHDDSLRHSWRKTHTNTGKAWLCLDAAGRRCSISFRWYRFRGSFCLWN